MQRDKRIAVPATAFFALLVLPQHANSMDDYACRLAVEESWAKSVQADSKKLAQARHVLFTSIGILLDTAYKKGGYVRNAKSFPVAFTDFRDNSIAFEFRTPCARAHVFLGELLQAYREHLSAEQRKKSPTLLVKDNP